MPRRRQNFVGTTGKRRLLTYRSNFPSLGLTLAGSYTAAPTSTRFPRILSRPVGQVNLVGQSPMKYSLRSLMIVVLVLPPLLAGAHFVLSAYNIAELRT